MECGSTRPTYPQTTLSSDLNLDARSGRRAAPRLAKYSSTAAAIELATCRCQSGDASSRASCGVAHVAELDQHRGRLGLLADLERRRAGGVARQARSSASDATAGGRGSRPKNSPSRAASDRSGCSSRDRSPPRRRSRRRPGCRRRSPCRPAAGPAGSKPAPTACRRWRRARSARAPAPPTVSAWIEMNRLARLLARDGQPPVERHEHVGGARHLHVVAPLGGQDGAQVAGHRQHHVLLDHLAADGAGIDAAVAGIDDDDRLGVWPGAGLAASSGRSRASWCAERAAAAWRMKLAAIGRRQDRC